MAILSTVKKVIPYIKEAAGYVLCHISSQAVEMDDGTLLQDKIESMDSEIDGKANTSHTHTATQVKGLTASRALVSNSSGQPSVSNVTSTELNYLDGVTSNIQNQINTLNSNSVILNSNDSYQKISLVLRNNKHILRYTRKATVPNNTTVTTISSGHRPSATVTSVCTCRHSNGQCGMGQLTIYTDGRVTLGALNYNTDIAGGEFYAEW